MSKPWQADIHIDCQLVSCLIQEQFPQLMPLELKAFGMGWDNAAFLVNELYVFRFPRREVAVALTETEVSVLPALAQHLPVAIPRPLFVGEAGPRYPYPFAGYALLPGETACVVNPSLVERQALARPLAEFLVALHAQKPLARTRKAPYDDYQRTELVVLCGKISDGLAQLQSELSAQQRAAAHALMTAPLHFKHRQKVLVHGDLYVRHLLLDKHRQLVGVIDWGDLHIGEAAVDLVIAWTFLPRSAHEAFLAAYGPVEPQDWAMARLRGLFYGVVLGNFANDVNDADLKRESGWIFEQVLGSV